MRKTEIRRRLARIEALNRRYLEMQDAANRQGEKIADQIEQLTEVTGLVVARLDGEECSAELAQALDQLHAQITADVTYRKKVVDLQAFRKQQERDDD